MTNKKRIKKLINKRYHTEKFGARYPWSFKFNPVLKLSEMFSALNEATLSAMRNVRLFSHYQNSISLLNGDPQIRNENPIIPLSFPEDKREAYAWQLENTRSCKSLLDSLIQESMQKVTREQSLQLMCYIRKNLESFGYYFDSEDEFLNFAKDRITRISFAENIYRFEYYLDYASESDKGILIGISNSKVEWVTEPNRITVTIG